LDWGGLCGVGLCGVGLCGLDWGGVGLGMGEEGEEASLATPGSLLHIQILLAQTAKQLGLWPHDTTMVPDCL
jgi:hypothetical protein